MKKYLVLFICAAVGLSSCKLAKPDYYGTESFIQFYFPTATALQLRKAYPVEGDNYMPTLTKDNPECTVHYKLALVGHPENRPRVIRFEQYVDPKDNFKVPMAGTNFVPFDDPQMVQEYVLPANSTTVEIPVTLRYDPNTEGMAQSFRLLFRIVDSEDLKLIYCNSAGTLVFYQR